MELLKKIYKKNIINYFIIIQPIVDVITSFMMLKMNISITLGMVIRSLFLLYSIAYLLLISKKHRKLKIVYFIVLFVYSINFFITNCTGSFMIKELINFSKFIYFPIVILFFVEYLEQNSVKTIYKASIVLNIIMFISEITGTYILSYGAGKVGNSGFFFSANELSLIVSILFPIVYYYYINKSKKFNTFILLLMFMSMLVIGTKTSYIAILITLFGYIVFLFFDKIRNKVEIGKKLKKTIVIIFIIILITPMTPIYHNMNYHFKYLKITNIFNLFKSNGKKPNNNEVPEITVDQEIENLVFYGREQYIKDIKPVYEKSPIENKLFGLGRYVKNNEVVYSLYQVERDVYDILFQYGIIGLLIELIIPSYLVIEIICKILKTRMKKIDEQVFFLGISVLIGYLISYMAGHTLLSISCATYLSFIMANLYNLIIIEQKKEIKKVMFISSVGGHLTQLLELKKIFNNYDYVLVTEKTDVTSNLKEKYKTEYLVYGSRKYLIKYLFIFTFNILKSFYLIIKYDSDVIVTTGTHTAVPSCYIGWLMDKKIIYIESFAKNKDQTLTGKLVYPIASVFVVQWENMLKFYPKAKYWGGIY